MRVAASSSKVTQFPRESFPFSHASGAALRAPQTLGGVVPCSSASQRWSVSSRDQKEGSQQSVKQSVRLDLQQAEAAALAAESRVAQLEG